MNIFTFPYGEGCFYTRPDTSVSEESIFYVPDGVNKIIAVPLVYIKIERAGKSIPSVFARRHYSKCGYGIHFQAKFAHCAWVKEAENNGEQKGDDNNTETACKYFLCNSLDNSTFLMSCGSVENIGSTKCSREFNSEQFDMAVETVSKYLSLRTGDIIALELPAIKQIEIASHKEGAAISYGDLNISIVS